MTKKPTPNSDAPDRADVTTRDGAPLDLARLVRQGRIRTATVEGRMKLLERARGAAKKAK